MVVWTNKYTTNGSVDEQIYNQCPIDKYDVVLRDDKNHVPRLFMSASTTNSALLMVISIIIEVQRW